MPLELISGTALWGQVDWGGFAYGGGGTLVFPPSLRLEKNDFDLRLSEMARALAHGAAVFGQEVQPRDIVVEGEVLDSGDEDAHLEAMNRLRQECARPDLRLRYRPEFFVNLARMKGFDHEWQELSGRTMSRVRISWRAADPFWYAAEETVVTEELAGDGQVVVDTGVGDWPARVEVWPVLTVTAPPAGSVPSVLLRNESDEGMQLVYRDLSLKNGAAVVFNTDVHTVSRGGVNTLRFFDGAPLRLLPGENRLTYEGAACTLTIRYRKRWI